MQKLPGCCSPSRSLEEVIAKCGKGCHPWNPGVGDGTYLRFNGKRQKTAVTGGARVYTSPEFFRPAWSERKISREGWTSTWLRWVLPNVGKMQKGAATDGVPCDSLETAQRLPQDLTTRGYPGRTSRTPLPSASDWSETSPKSRRFRGKLQKKLSPRGFPERSLCEFLKALRILNVGQENSL